MWAKSSVQRFDIQSLIVVITTIFFMTFLLELLSSILMLRICLRYNYSWSFLYFFAEHFVKSVSCSEAFSEKAKELFLIKWMNLICSLFDIIIAFHNQPTWIWLHIATVYHFSLFKGCLPQILLGPFLNTLTHMY